MVRNHLILKCSNSDRFLYFFFKMCVFSALVFSYQMIIANILRVIKTQSKQDYSIFFELLIGETQLLLKKKFDEKGFRCIARQIIQKSTN